MPLERVVVPGLARLPAFCHATVAGDFVFVSGTLGTVPGGMALIAGGAGPETKQALQNIETILRACGATLSDIAKADIFLRDLQDFGAMNAAWLEIFGEEVPARITVGRAGLALGAAVEVECVAYVPRSGA